MKYVKTAKKTWINIDIVRIYLINLPFVDIDITFTIQIIVMIVTICMRTRAFRTLSFGFGTLSAPNIEL